MGTKKPKGLSPEPNYGTHKDPHNDRCEALFLIDRQTKEVMVKVLTEILKKRKRGDRMVRENLGGIRRLGKCWPEIMGYVSLK